MRVIIAGSRTIHDYDVLVSAIKDSGLEITEVVCGMAVGVDLMGLRWALENNIPVKRLPANWKRYGNSAGYRRNVDMAEYADALILVWDGTSRGSKHMLDIASSKGMKMFVREIKA